MTSDHQTTNHGDDLAPVAVVVAMLSELRHLLVEMHLTPTPPGVVPATIAGLVEFTAPEPNAHPVGGGWPTWRGSVQGQPVIAVLSGIGPAQSAAATAALLATHRVRAVINYGCAGAHRHDIPPGDVVIGDRSVNHAAVYVLPDGTRQYRQNADQSIPDPLPLSDLPSDPTLLAVAHQAAEGWTPEPWPRRHMTPNPETGSEDAPRVHVGAVASADAWTQAPTELELLHQQHGSLCEEMEAAAIALICARYAVPFLPIKDISNNEFLGPTELATGLAFAEVGKRAAALVVRILARLS